MLKVYKYEKNKKITPLQQRIANLLKHVMPLILGLSLIFNSTGLKYLNFNRAYANESTYITSEGYANQWARSDIRAYLNGLTKTNNNLPIDGSSGTKSDDNFLNCFTNEELNFFKAKDVTTTMFNEINEDSDDNFYGTISEITTKDKFWLPSGHYDYTGTALSYENYVISADPSYDLSYYCTYKQKVVNGKENSWKNIIPIPFWGGIMFTWLRSAAYDDDTYALYNTPGFDIDESDTDWSIDACPCGYFDISSVRFASVAKASATISSSLSEKNIDGYNKLGIKDPQSNYNTPIPSWGIYLKKISNSLNLDGTLTYDSNNNKLTFETSSTFPKNKYLMVQAYKPWDESKTSTENAASGDTVYIAGQKIENDSTTSVEFTEVPSDIEDLIIKIWIEEETDSLPETSTPITFKFEENNELSRVNEESSTNPRVFAYKNDLGCSWGTYENETDRFTLSAGEIFNERQSYVGDNATWQKLYIGTGNNGNPIEWFIASRDDDGLVLYLNRGFAFRERNTYRFTREFNELTEPYEGNGLAKNPTLVLSDDLTSDDLENISTKVTLTYDGEIINNIPSDKYSIQYCKAANGKMTGFEWLDTTDGPGKYSVRIAFAGATVDDTTYAPCFSPVKLISIDDTWISVSSVELDKTELTLCPNKTEALSVTVLPEDTNDKTVTWTSSNENVATVSQEGLVTAVATGIATITATTQDKSASCKVTVEHKLNDTWLYNETEHWHECSYCAEKSDQAKHNYDNVSYNWEQDGANWKCTAVRHCTECGYEDLENATVTSSIADIPNWKHSKEKIYTATFTKLGLETQTRRDLMLCSTKLNGQEINCILENPSNTIPDNTYLKIVLVEPNTDRWNELTSQLDDTHTIENIAFFEIALFYKSNDELVQSMPLDHKVKMLLQIPDGWNKSDIEVVLIAAGKDIEFEEDIVTIDGVSYVVFWTDHFSPYAIIDKLVDNELEAIDSELGAIDNELETIDKGKSIDEVEEKETQNWTHLSTGESSEAYVVCSMILISASLIFLLSVRIKKNKT